MNQPEAIAAWRLYQINWIPIQLMALALAIGLSLGDFALDLRGAVASFVFVAVYALVAQYNVKAPHRRDPQVVFVLGSTAQIVLVTVLMAPMTYVVAAANLPMRDADLLAIDRMLGLDWGAYVDYVNRHPLLADWLSYGYSMIRWPIFGIPVVLAAAHRYRRIQEFTLAFSLALIATTVLSTLVPAYGVYQQIGLDPATLTNIDARAYLDTVRDLGPVRAGALRTLDLFGLAGIVTFPSFHAASALLYAWAFWPVRWMRPVAVLANGMMLASTPIDGGHYFIDVMAGLAIAAIAIRLACKVSGRKPASACDLPAVAPVQAEKAAAG